ncbi:HlyD family efflux transporter periplasmic adaptor subunit [Azohydromonas australica]|uniref:HlyD family efflux transporter periplasmic adaptor subunit n=1 Tax=Azohydromonas australica TaxID=364039 RepID=UPI00040B386B|nr:HlyD family efflux transporter periplasmic adaptor subunit [Azohydromonas australica]
MLTPAPAAPWPALREELQLHDGGSNRDGSPAWHIGDPVRNLFFRIGWLELEMLRRWRLGSAQAIAEEISRHTTLAPEPEDVREFASFLAAHQLLQQARPQTRSPLWRWLLNNYLFIRIPLLRPARLLQVLLPWVGWLFTPRFLGLTVLAALAGVALALRQLDTVEANLRGAMSWEGVLGFAGALFVSKLLHEFGHALVATRLGVRVGHMGVALLVMWPMPYTDTGESWMRSPRRRLAIASAGIAAELVLAAWCTLAWSFVPEGSLRNALFFLATTAWVLTLAVNASPFMRFDGYYILADALDLPGLHERAGRLGRHALRRWLPGFDDPVPEVLPPAWRRGLMAFAFATWLYRLVVFVGIAIVVYHAFFKALGVFLFFVEIVVFVIRPLWAELRVWWRRRSEVAPRRAVAALAVLAAALLGLLPPWWGGVTAPGVLRAAAEQPVFSPYAARLEHVRMAEGARVEADTPLAELAAPAQQQERDKARALSAAYSRAARGALGMERDGAAQGVAAEQQATRWEAQRRAHEAELQRLHLLPLEQGVVRDLDQTLRPGTWVGASRPLAVVVDGRHWRVEALVPERERLRLATGTPAVVIAQGRFRKLAGHVIAIDDSPVARLPHLLLAQEHGGVVPLNPTLPRHDLKPAGAWFRVLVEGTLDGEGAVPVTAVQSVRVHFQGTRESLARTWMESALSVLIQQSGL